MSLQSFTVTPANPNSFLDTNNQRIESNLYFFPNTTDQLNQVSVNDGRVAYNTDVERLQCIINNEFQSLIIEGDVPGVTGNTGATGATGARGATGATGPTGPVNLSGQQLIASQILGATAASVTFSAIPQTYHNLKLVITAQSDTAGSGAGTSDLQANYNGDTGANYLWNQSYATQSSTNGAAFSYPPSVARIGGIGQAGNAPNIGSVIVDIINYTNTTFSKTSLGGSMTAGIWDYVGAIWANTSAITSILLTMDSGNFIPGSIFLLYGY